MLKKLISFICCLLPVGAGAVVVSPEVGQNAVSTEQSAWTDAIAANETITISDSNVNGIMSDGGFSLTNNMYVGAATDQGSMSGDLYVLNTVQNPFTVVTRGPVSIGAMLQVMDGKSLGFKTSDTNPNAYNLTVGGNVVVGSASQMASLTVSGAEFFDVRGSVQSYGNFTVSASGVELGAINANAGYMNITTTYNDLMVNGDIVSFADGMNVDAYNMLIAGGTVQNNGGSMDWNAGAGLLVDGNFENKSAASVDFSAGGNGILIAGALTNENADATMTINTTALFIGRGNGGGSEWHTDYEISFNEGSNGYSLLNNGNFAAVVDDVAHFEYGINLAGMASDNTFSLDVGSLSFGDSANEQMWFNAFSNYLDSFSVAVRNDSLGLNGVLNGINADGDINADANMNLQANNIYATSVRNQGGTLQMTANKLPGEQPHSSEDNGVIAIDGPVVGVAGSDTLLTAEGALYVSGAATNAGTMTLNGNAVEIASAVNSGTGANLTVSSLTETSGTVSVLEDITNTAGVTTVWAKNVNIDGVVTNNSGVTNIRGSDYMGGVVEIGALDIQGGSVNLNALAGSATIDNDLVVSGGNLNLGSSLISLSVGGNVDISGDVNLVAGAATGAGNVNVAASGAQVLVMKSDSGVINIDGDVNATDDSVARGVQFVADSGITVGGDVVAANKGTIKFGNAMSDAAGTSFVDITGDLDVTNGGVAEIHTYRAEMKSLNLDGGKIVASGNSVTANTGNIDIDGNLFYAAYVPPATPVTLGFQTQVEPTVGFVINNTPDFTLSTTASGADINMGAAFVGAGSTLRLKSANNLTIDGRVDNAGAIIANVAQEITINGELNSLDNVDLTAKVINAADINNEADASFVATDGAITVVNIANAGTLSMNATDIVASAIGQTGGSMTLGANTLSAQSLIVSGAAGTQADLNVDNVTISGNTSVSGDLVQGGASGMLNFAGSTFETTNLTVGGDFVANAGSATYDINRMLTIAGDINVASGAESIINADSISVTDDLINAGALTLASANSVTFDEIVMNDGVVNVDTGRGVLGYAALAMNGGNLVLDGAGMITEGKFNTGAMLYQNYADILQSKDINIIADDYGIVTAGLDVAGINQSGKLGIVTSDVDVGGDIIASDLVIMAQKLPDGVSADWMNVDIAGSVSGNVDFIGLEKMTIGGGYVFNDNSRINAAILPYAAGASMNTTDINYWASVSLNDDDTLGEITNPDDDTARALIEVAGKFETELNTLGALSGGKLSDAQFGINIFDIVDQGTAIWFLHADEGISELATKIRNLSVSFCNADGSLCYDYLDSLDANNGAGDELPAYVSVRDNNDDGTADSLYIVFDPRFGGPVEVFKIQPIVGRENTHTDGEYTSAGALDDLIAGQLVNKQFYNKTPIEVIPLIFQDTNLSQMADELYNRMEDYVMNRDGAPLSRFSRLFQVRELEQIAGSIALNEHTTFRSFEDRMYDEFIWNRHRNLNKAWLDVDYGMFYQNIDDGKHTDGNRFSVAAGFDWQQSDTLVLGLTGRVSHTTSDAHDEIDLSYPGNVAAGEVQIAVKDTDVALGGYMMKVLGEKTRLYGNVFADLHLFDVDRYQNFVDPIDGDGSAFSLISEWGLMHNILNQYVVGNLYARVGYNFGFDIKEKAAGDDYMRLSGDGYFILTPGYSLTAQKRIYPSAWFQIRPYASVGVEYDVFGMPDVAEYKFVVADKFTDYDLEINPLWANIGGGIEMLSANGLQFGVDYRYQYNSDIQLHNIRVSGSYRF